ncbi:MAG: hypothetical protein J6C46_02960 [Clostridia bacterium]|nr:hypothetical protein [Clostridia bacterium]
MSQKSSEKWETPTLEEIIEQLIKESDKGNSFTTFYKSIISDSVAEKLRQKGYTIIISKIANSPYFKIYW